jgi:hypothetical protein
MKTLPAEASDEEILDAVREWVRLLAEERYEEAYHFFVLTELNPWHWSPQLLKTLIQTHGFYDKQELSTVTPVEKTTGGLEPAHAVHRYNDGERRGYIWFDLPLNGKWSDLTAVLTFRVNNERLVIELESIEVK